MKPANLVRGLVSVHAEASPTELINALNTAFHEFKTEHKKQLDGMNDSLQKIKVERINEEISNLQSAIDTANEKIAGMQMNGGGAGGLKDPEYTDSFVAHFKKGDVQAALNKGVAEEGGYLAPIEWDRTITDRLVQISPMRSICSVQKLGKAGFSKLFTERGTTSGWVGETDSRPQTATSKFRKLEYTSGEIYANPAATQQMLDDAEIDLEAWLAREVDTEFALQEGVAFISGDGVNKPTGLLTYIVGGANAAKHPWGAIETIDSGAADAVTSDSILDLIYGLPGEYTGNARFTMNRTTMGQIRKLKDGQGNYLWQPSAQAGQPSLLSGYPVTEMAGMPDVAAGSTPIMFGDFLRGYLILDRTGVRVLRDPFTNKPYVHFYTTKRVGGGLLNPDVLKALKIGEATAP